MSLRRREEIRVYVVGDVERLACVGRVDFEVHGGQCIVHRKDVERQTWLLEWALAFQSQPIFALLAGVTWSLTRQNLIQSPNMKTLKQFTRKLLVYVASI